MLRVKTNVLSYVKSNLYSREKECGFALGSSIDYDLIDHIELIPAAESGLYFYIPDRGRANQIVKTWAAKTVCFSGFLHSHPEGKCTFSQSDLDFAMKLLAEYKLPFLWFGLAVIRKDNVDISFVKADLHNGEIYIEECAVQEI